MEINDRIRELRSHLKLSQKVFGQKIHLKQNSIAVIELGIRNPSNRTIIDICKYYNVSEIWLRTGEGDMLVDEEHNELNQLFDKLGADDTDRQMFMSYFQMSPEDRRVIKDWFKMASEMNSDNE